MFSLIFTGVIGSMCWPMIFQCIYTASGIRSVKKGTLLTIALFELAAVRRKPLGRAVIN
ncbi:MAG: hypothetical protein ACRC0C_01155 [Gibbsiella quercinecans]|uniref:hypothetical protein n=1 Tax=Gibbsiella quercinecans TaxID=929813 RepID=UPI003F344FEE